MKITVTQIHDCLRLLVASASFFVAICLGIVLLHLNGTLGKVDTTITSVNKEIEAIDITRKSLDDLMVQTTVLIIDADTAATKETAVLDSVNHNVTSTLGDLDTAVRALTQNQNEITTHTVQAIDATTKTISGVQPVLEQAKATLGTANESAEDVRKLINSPVIPETLTSVQQVAANTAAITKSGASIASDAADETHKLVHPDKRKLGFWATVNAVVMYLNRFKPSIF